MFVLIALAGHRPAGHPEELADRFDGQAVRGVAVPASHCRSGQQTVEHRLLGGFDDRGEERIQRPSGQRPRPGRRAPGGRRPRRRPADRAARSPWRERSRRCRDGRWSRFGPVRARPGGPGERTRPSRAERRSRPPRCTSRLARACGASGLAIGRQQPPHRHAVDGQPLPRAEVREQQHADDVPRRGHARRAADPALEAQAAHAGPGADRSFVGRGSPGRGPGGGQRGADVGARSPASCGHR